MWPQEVPKPKANPFGVSPSWTALESPHQVPLQGGASGSWNVPSAGSGTGCVAGPALLGHLTPGNG